MFWKKSEKIWKMIVEILSQIAELFEIDTKSLMQKLISDNERFMKLLNYNTLLQAGLTELAKVKLFILFQLFQKRLLKSF